jgi:hypothetical protein
LKPKSPDFFFYAVAEVLGEGRRCPGFSRQRLRLDPSSFEALM